MNLFISIVELYKLTTVSFIKSDLYMLRKQNYMNPRLRILNVTKNARLCNTAQLAPIVIEDNVYESL